jgi:transposase-like protein
MPQPAAERWRAIVWRARQSGQSMNAFARANGLNANTLAWWSWRIGADARSASPAPLLEPAFVEAVLTAPGTGPRLHVQVGAARIEVDADTDLDLLRRVVGALT